MCSSDLDTNKATTDNGTTPLFIACQKGHGEVVALLIKAGADTHKATTDDGNDSAVLLLQ